MAKNFKRGLIWLDAIHNRIADKICRDPKIYKLSCKAFLQALVFSAYYVLFSSQIMYVFYAGMGHAMLAGYLASKELVNE